MKSEEHVFDLLPLYALGSLDEAEELLVREHLKSCEHCQVELKNYRQIVNELPLAMVETEPPSTLKEKVLGQIAADRNRARKPDKLSLWQQFVQLLQRSAPAWGLASLVLVIILSLSNLLLWQRLNSLENITNTPLMTIALYGTEFTPDASGMLVISRDGEHGTLIVDGLPSLDESMQYQLWLIEDGQRTSGGVFSADEDGYGSLWVSSSAPLVSYSAFGITVEPAGGSPGPTGQKVLGGQL